MKKILFNKAVIISAAAFGSLIFIITAACSMLPDKARVMKKLSVKISPFIFREDFEFLEELADILIKYNFVYKIIFESQKCRIIRTKDIHSTRIKIFTRTLIHKNKKIGFLEIAYS